MSEPKRLTPETLEENLRFVADAVGLGAADEIRGHIAVLEDENRALAQRAEQAEREKDEVRRQRDEFRRIGEQFQRDARKHFDQSCTNLNERDAARQEAERLAQHIRLDAEHVAILRRDLGAGETETVRGVAVRLKQEAEALRARVAELEGMVADSLEAVNGPGGWRDALEVEKRLRKDDATDHAKALVRTRNEGLEKAARLAEDAATTCTCRARHYSNCSCHWSERLDKAGDDIRDMKEPE